jgi:hypothetical protein
VATAYAVEDRFVAAAFSAARPGTTLPAGWVPLEASNIKVRTRYTLVDDNGTTVLRADSERGASGLSRQLRINPSDLPWLRWRWKISNLIETIFRPGSMSCLITLLKNCPSWNATN